MSLGKLSLLLGPRTLLPAPPTPGFDYIVHNVAELVAAVDASVASGVFKKIGVADGDYGTTQIQLRNKNAAAGILIEGVDWRSTTALIPGIHLENCRNIKLSKLKAYLPRTIGVPGGVFNCVGTQNIDIDDCEIYSDTLADQFFGGTFRAEDVSATPFQDGEQVRVELAGVPNGSFGYFRNFPGISTTTNIAISGAGGAKTGNGIGGPWDDTTKPERWYDATVPRQIRGLSSGATATVREKTNSVEFMVGVYSSTTQPSPGLRVTNCYIHDTKRGIGASGQYMFFFGNRIEDSYNAPIDVSGDFEGTIADANDCIGVWAQSTDGEPSGTNGPHSSVFGLSATWRVIQYFRMWGNKLLVGSRRQAAGWGVPFATGPKNNDQESTKTITLAGTSGTVNSAASATWQIVPGTRLIGAGVLPGTVVTSVTSGIGAAGTTFQFSPAQTLSSRVMYVQGRVGWDLSGNIIDCNGAIGIEWDFVLASAMCKWNILFSTRDTRLTPTPTIPQFYLANIDGGAASHNIFLQPALGAVSRCINEQFYRDSYDNAMLIMGATTGPASYEGALQGVGGPNPFSSATLENIVEMVTPIPGGAADGRGPTYFWDFDARVPLNPPDPPAPITALATGVSMPMVRFGGSTVMRYTVAGAENLIDITDPSVFTQVWYIDPRGADGNANLATSGPTGSDIYMRRLTSGSDNRLRFILKDSAGTTQQIDSVFTLSAADGPVVVAVSVDFANYKIFIWKGATVDPFPSVSAWTGLPMRVTANTLTVFGSELSTPAAILECDSGAYIAHDGFLDGDDPAVHTRLVALDGKPANWGSAAATLFGEPVLAMLAGVASGYTNPAGLNLGTATQKFIQIGPDVTNV